MQVRSFDSQTANMLRDRGIAACRAGEKARARELLLDAVRIDPVNEYAWLWLAAAVTTKAERQYCLGRVLAINPQNETARCALQKLRPVAPVEPRPAPQPNQTLSLALPPGQTQPAAQIPSPRPATHPWRPVLLSVAELAGEALLSLAVAALTFGCAVAVYAAISRLAVPQPLPAIPGVAAGILVMFFFAGLFRHRDRRECEELKARLKWRDQALFTAIEKSISALLAEKVG